MHRIDAHQHFWNFDPVKNSWITDEMKIIRKDFLPEDIKPLLQQNNFEGCVAVQADQSENETMFLVELSKRNDFIKGIVGWVDLKADNVEQRLDHFKTFDSVKGFRHILQGEKNRRFMLQESFKKGIKLLEKYNFTYDILIYPDQLTYTKEFVAAFPQQKFVIDHLAKPDIRNGDSNEWEADIFALAKFKNVYCKISGMVTEAHWNNWKQEDFVPYIDTVVNAFGPDRIMFGSDWPVCLVAASYKNVAKITADYFSSFSKTEQDNFFGGNAIQFYNLSN